MAISLDLATIYIMDAFRASFLLMTEVFRAIALNPTIADNATQDIYYLFGFIRWMSYALNDMVWVINTEMTANNTTWKNWMVGYWQKVALNRIWVFGDWNGEWGLAYVWRRGWTCIQPGQYCFNVNYGNATVHDALEMVKWMYNATSKIGERMSTWFP